MTLCLLVLSALLSLFQETARSKEEYRDLCCLPAEGLVAVPEAPLVWEATGIIFPHDATTTVALKSTARIPDADGKVRVETRQGETLLKVKLDDMKPATLFGGDYNTYVFWAVSPEGIAHNLGELVLNGDDSELEAATVLDQFAMIVTAEPHYLVSFPSPFVVLEEAANDGDIRDGRGLTIHYQGYQGSYTYVHGTLADMKEVKGPVRTDISQAWTAVRLARRVHAERWARLPLEKAEQALDRMAKAWLTRDSSEVQFQARETIKFAVEAQRLAKQHVKRAVP